MNKICEFCGQLIDPTSRSIKYCSQECRIKANHKKFRYKCICANCGKEFFKSSKPKQKNVFCCNKCVGEYNSKKHTEERTCEFCKKKFTAIFSDPKRFCSVKCQNLWQKTYPRTGENHPSYNHAISKEERTLICQWCGKEYLVQPYKIKTSKFCCGTCKHEAMIYAARTQKTWEERVNTEPQRIVNKLLEDLGISYQNEYFCGYYFSIDNFCLDSGLMIEVMGTYWHADIRNNSTINDIQKRDIIQDKRKKTYIKNKYGVNILYLWEKDLKEDPLLCKILIQEYINKSGVLSDYNSFNYHLEDNKLCLNKKIIVGYMDKENNYKKIIHYNKALND